MCIRDSAHAQDDFTTIQDVLIATRGKLSEIYGIRLWSTHTLKNLFRRRYNKINGIFRVVNDYYVHLMNFWEDVEAKYETEIPDDAGSIEFFDPRHGVEMVPVPGNPFGQRISFPAENGRLLCFPAWLRHTVNPYLGKHERVSIAFNVRIEKFESFD